VSALVVDRKPETCLRFRLCKCFLFLLLTGSCYAQVCQTAADMEPAARTALETTAKRYFGMAAAGDVAGLKQNSISAVAQNFSGIETAIKDNQAVLSGVEPTVRPPFLLSANGAEVLPRAEFLCGVFGAAGQTKSSAVFVLNNLPPGKYSVTILDGAGAKGATTLTFILQQVSSDWKLAGFYVKAPQAAGHDAAWYGEKARAFKAKGQSHDAWLYFRQALSLAAPVEFMSTLSTDKLYDEMQSVQPADLPKNGNAADLTAAGKTYHLTEIFPQAVGNDLDLVIKYQALSDVSDTAHAFQDNSALIKALVAKYPEFRDAFAGVVARAVDASGKDYGTLLAMKDVK
jgi:hypothetical protein